MAQKVTVRAVHAVRLTVKPGVNATKDSPAVRPEFKDIAPGTLFNVDPQMADYLKKQGAVEYVAEVPAAPVVVDHDAQDDRPARGKPGPKGPRKPKEAVNPATTQAPDPVVENTDESTGEEDEDPDERDVI